MDKRLKIFIKYIVSPLLATWLFYALFQQIKHQPNFAEELELIKKSPFGNQGYKFWIILILVFFNWGFEARKWQLLIKPVQPMHYWDAFKSVLSGMAMSLNMPNRIGEYAGRILFIGEGNRLKAVSLSIAGSLAQLIVTMFMGCIGVAYLLFSKNTFGIDLGLSTFWLRLFFYGSIFGTTLFLLFFFKLGWLISLIEKLPFAHKFAKHIAVLEKFDSKILIQLLQLSFCRYLVFSLQYLLAFQLMNVEMNFWQSFWLITIMFWILAIIPSFSIADLGIRGTVAKTLFAFTANTIGVVAVTFGIWFVNLFIPAIIGSLFILSIKIKNKNEKTVA